MTALSKLITTLNRLLFIVAGIIIFAVVPMLLFEVVARYAFNAPTVWAMEASTLVFGPHFLLAGPYLLHLRGHVAVDILSEKAAPRTRAILDLIALVIVALFAIIIVRVSWPLAVNSYALNETSFSAWNPPIWWVKFVVPVAFFMLLAQAIAELWSAFIRFRTGRDEVQA